MPGGQSGGRSQELAQGEDPSTASLEEAKRWVGIYTELVQLENSILETMKGKLSGMSRTARKIAEETNLPALEKDITNFRQRLDVWQKRLAELERTN